MKMIIECPYCSEEIWITLEQIANSSVVRCENCRTEIQLEFRYCIKPKKQKKVRQKQAI